MKTNEELQKDVQEAIKWEPLLNVAEIGVIAKDGIITLTGIVDSFAKKMEVEEVSKNVSGVKAVVEKIEIKFGNMVKNDGNEIAKEVLNAFKFSWEVPDDKIKVTVEDGLVNLEGELQWNYQKEAVKNSIKHITGVKGVVNNIKIKSEISDDVEKRDIERAIQRNWAIKDLNIQVGVSGNRVILTGKVFSVYQKEQATKIAWNAPGVIEVENELTIE